MSYTNGLLFLFAVFYSFIVSVYGKAPQKIFGGSPAQLGEYPFVVSLQINGQHICGGSIIRNDYILTAAHCVATANLNDIYVVTGSIFYKQRSNSYRVKMAWFHSLYNHRDSASPNDLAIIKLQNPIQFNSYQNKIDITNFDVSTGVQATAIGWGVTNGYSPVISDILMKITLTTVDAGRCQKYLPTQLWTNQICIAGLPGYGVCSGDSGGPLIYNNHLIGVTSYGIPCARGSPDVFTSLYHYRKWILTFLNN